MGKYYYNTNINFFSLPKEKKKILSSLSGNSFNFMFILDRSFLLPNNRSTSNSNFRGFFRRLHIKKSSCSFTISHTVPFNQLTPSSFTISRFVADNVFLRILGTLINPFCYHRWFSSFDRIICCFLKAELKSHHIPLDLWYGSCHHTFFFGCKLCSFSSLWSLEVSVLHWMEKLKFIDSVSLGAQS